MEVSFSEASANCQKPNCASVLMVLCPFIHVPAPDTRCCLARMGWRQERKSHTTWFLGNSGYFLAASKRAKHVIKGRGDYLSVILGLQIM